MKGGSDRIYERVTLPDGRGAVSTTGTDRDENAAFIYLSRHFRSKGIHVPEVLDVSEDGMSYIQEDLGDTVLYDAVAHGRESGTYSPEEIALLKKAISKLPEIQIKGAEGLDWSICYPDREFNARMVDFDLSYFKYCFLKPWGVEFNEIRLQDDFDAPKEDLLAVTADGFMYRDFQARNVMLRDGEPWFIDFQGGRKGPSHYDVASFICQARSRFPQALKDELVDAYLDARPDVSDRTSWKKTLRIFMLLRCLQTLGAYGFRGKIEKKAHFLESIPYAVRGIHELVAEPFDRYPYLCEVLNLIRCEEPEAPVEGLTVDVMSFSFRKGLPEDRTGNGGGYIFDCRSTHNPGRYDRYKQSTGRDADVIKFLEDNGETAVYLESVYKLVDFHVKRYLERGFSHLQVAFGCTGGQHRSVYCAEHTAEHLRSLFPEVNVTLTHREQNSWPKKK